MHVLYTRNLNKNNHTGRLCRFWYERVYFFLPLALGDTRRDTQFIKAYANYTMQTTPSPHTVHLVVSKISTYLCRSWPKLIWSHQIRKKINRSLQRSNLNSRLFKILRFSRPSLPGMMSPTPQFTLTAHPDQFPIRQFIMTVDDCHILSERACKCPLWLWHLNQGHQVIQNLTKLND